MIIISILLLILFEAGFVHFSIEGGERVKNANVWRWVFGIGLWLSFICLVVFTALEGVGCGI